MMFREKSISKLYAFALAAVFALTLAGCGGGGGTAATPPDETPMPTPQEMCVADKGEGSVIVDGMCYSATENEVRMCVAAGGRDNMDGTCTSAEGVEQEKLADAKNAAKMAYEAAKMALAAVMDDASHDMDSYGMAQEALNQAKAANDVAQAATTSANAEAAQKQVETARDNVRKYAGMVTTAKNTADAKAEQVKMNKVAQTKIDAIGVEAGAGTDEAFDASSDPYTVTVSRKIGEAMSVKINHGASDDDPTFEMNADGMHVLGPNKAGVSEVVMVHSNIEEPTPTAFAKVHTLDARLDAESGVATPQASPTDEMPNTVLQIAGADALPMIMASSFRAPADTTGTAQLTFKGRVADDTSTPNVDETAPGKMIAGTFNGAMGTYQCVVTSDCTVTVNAKGVVSGVSTDNDWVFIPADGAMVEVDDSVYYYYGFWVKKTETEDDGLMYNAVQTFAGGHGDPIADVTSGIVEGEAKYEGGAAGVYGHKSFNPDGSENVVSSGTFTAKASLTAYFGSTSTEVGTAFHNTLRGEITDFNLSGGEAQEWKVDLTRTTLSGSGTSNDGSAAGATQWNAVFYSAGKDADGEGTGTALTPPQIVVGEFNADFPNDNGSVAGAFGAELQVKE